MSPRAHEETQSCGRSLNLCVYAAVLQGLLPTTDFVSLASGLAYVYHLMPLASSFRADEVAMIMTNLEKANQVS